jgi:hypothetical protein
LLIAVAAPAPLPAAPTYASFVCWKYTALPPLPAWKETESIIATTLAESFPTLRTLDRRENGSPQVLKSFLAQLPDAADQITVVYLAAHQTPSGRWVFPDRSAASWGALATGLPILRAPNRIVLLDCCHARSASLWPGWSAKIAPASIFASPENARTPDLFVFRRQSVDCEALFPKAVPWLRRHHIDDLDQRVSFFGMVWLETWLNQSAPPRSLGEWKNLAQAMAARAGQVEGQVRTDEGSEISLSFPEE